MRAVRASNNRPGNELAVAIERTRAQLWRQCEWRRTQPLIDVSAEQQSA